MAWHAEQMVNSLEDMRQDLYRVSQIDTYRGNENSPPCEELDTISLKKETSFEMFDSHIGMYNAIIIENFIRRMYTFPDGNQLTLMLDEFSNNGEVYDLYTYTTRNKCYCYLILEGILGSGASGDVRRAKTFNTQTGEVRVFAVKELQCDVNSKFVASLYKVCSDENIGPSVPTDFFMLLDKTCYILMESYDSDLMDYISTNELSTNTISSIESQITEKLERLHYLGILCSDQKLKNILVKDVDGVKVKVVLTDFDTSYCCNIRSNSCLRKCNGDSKMSIYILKLQLFAAFHCYARVVRDVTSFFWKKVRYVCFLVLSFFLDCVRNRKCLFRRCFSSICVLNEGETSSCRAGCRVLCDVLCVSASDACSSGTSCVVCRSADEYGSLKSRVILNRAIQINY
jgi:tRNA A-37 threonylcarbamoyl transferase component Bud32